MGIEDSIIGFSSPLFVAAMNMAYAGIFALAFIALIVFCVLARKTWHWVNIVFLLLTFISGFAAIYGLSQVYAQRTAAVKDFNDAQKSLERESKAADLQIIGLPDSASYDPGTLRYIENILSQEFAGRGRVWSGGQITAENDNRVFTYSAERPAEFDPLKDIVLYAFNEQSPFGFIGSVRVVEETAQNVKLEAIALADFQQFAQPTGTWSLYEKMPLDRRGTFKRAIVSFAETNPNAAEELKSFAKTLEDETSELDVTKFRFLLQSEFLQPEKVGMDVNSQEYEKLIDRYAFDGLSLGTVQNWIDQNSATRKTPRFEPNKDEIFIEYEFNDASKKAGGYQVDSNGTIEVDGLFNSLGHAIDTALQAGGAIQFSKGDRVLVDQRTSEGYKRGEQQIPPFASEEDVKEVDRVYIRQVRDYPYEFVSLTLRAVSLDEEIQRVLSNNEVQKSYLADTNDQFTERERLKADLGADQTLLQSDLDTVTATAARKQQEVAQFRQTIASLSDKIDVVYKQLRDYSISISQKAFANR